MTTAECPSCGGKVNFGLKPRLGQRIICQSCKTDLEVTWLEPIELDWPYDGEDDDDDYDDDDDD